MQMELSLIECSYIQQALVRLAHDAIPENHLHDEHTPEQLALLELGARFSPMNVSTSREVSFGNLPLLYVVVYEGTMQKNDIRADYKIHETYNDALSRQLELGQVVKPDRL